MTNNPNHDFIRCLAVARSWLLYGKSHGLRPDFNHSTPCEMTIDCLSQWFRHNPLVVNFTQLEQAFEMIKRHPEWIGGSEDDA